MKFSIFKRSDVENLKPKRKKFGQMFASVFTAAMLFCCGAFSCFAAEGTVVSSSDWSSVITAITDQISVQTIVGVLGVAVAACVGLAFMWWGLRKAIGMLMAAFKKGKVKV